MYEKLEEHLFKSILVSSIPLVPEVFVFYFKKEYVQIQPIENTFAVIKKKGL